MKSSERGISGKRLYEISLRLLFLVPLIVLFSVNNSAAEETKSIEEAFKQGKFQGVIGDYYEYVSRDAADSDSGWGTAYLTLKYETSDWNRLKFGARFFAHGELYSDHDDGVTDPFNADVEDEVTLPELYLNYSFFEKSSVTVGRWNHKKISHIDDAQSEGFYFKLKDIPDFDLIIGDMIRFAEIDYDDGEDFGRTNDAQDLDNEAVYGAGSSSHLIFLEGKYTGIRNVTLSPYLMFQDDYANVIGLDSNIKLTLEEHDITYGLKAKYYHVNAEIQGSTDANVFFLMPYAKKGPFSIEFNYAEFDNGNSLNKPAWYRDFSLVDQKTAFGMAGSESFQTRIKYKKDKFWTHFAYSTSDFETSATRGQGSQEVELQLGYNFTKSLDLNIRLIDVQFDNIANRDYQKLETRTRFKF